MSETIDPGEAVHDLVHLSRYDFPGPAAPTEPTLSLQRNYLHRQLHLSDARELRPAVIPVTNAELNWRKPEPGTGLWTSTWVEEQRSSAWIGHTHARGNQWFVLTPSPNARITTIDSLVNLERLLKTYRRVFTGRRAWMTEFSYLDFEHLSQDFDAIHLTAKGQRKTRLTIPDLYGWDCESVLWFRWCFTDVRRIGPAI